MRVDIVVDNLRPYGGQKMAAVVAALLRDRGCVVRILVLESNCVDAGPDGVELVSLHRTHRGVLGLAQAVKNCSKSIDLHGTSVLIGFMTYANVCAAFAGRLARSRVKVVATEHNMASVALVNGERHPRTLGILARAAFKLCQTVVAVSVAVRQDLVENFGVRPSLIEVIYNPIDVDLIERDAARGREDVLDQIERRHLKRFLCLVGALKSAKGHSLVVEALPHLDEDVHLVCVGDGPLESLLRGLASRVGVSERIHFLGWQDTAAAWMSEATVVVQPSLYEGFGLSAAEAVALGCPVVGTDAGGLGEVLRLSGLSPVPCGDTAAFVRAVQSNLTAPALPDRAFVSGLTMDKVGDAYHSLVRALEGREKTTLPWRGTRRLTGLRHGEGK